MVCTSLLILAIAVAMLCILYVFAGFSYTISEGVLVIRWRILRWLPFQTHRIKMEDIRGARRFRAREDIFSGGHILGNPFSGKAVILAVRKTMFNPFGKILVTLENPDDFVAQISGRTAA